MGRNTPKELHRPRFELHHDAVAANFPRPLLDLIAQLGEAGLKATAQPGGYDTVTFVYGNESWSLRRQESTLDISSVWNKAEFNILGNSGGAEAQFDPGTTITVILVVGDGTGTAPPRIALTRRQDRLE